MTSQVSFSFAFIIFLFYCISRPCCESFIWYKKTFCVLGYSALSLSRRAYIPSFCWITQEALAKFIDCKTIPCFLKESPSSACHNNYFWGQGAIDSSWHGFSEPRLGEYTASSSLCLCQYPPEVLHCSRNRISVSSRKSVKFLIKCNNSTI